MYYIKATTNDAIPAMLLSQVSYHYNIIEKKVIKGFNKYTKNV